jgi:hypothetical protein
MLILALNNNHPLTNYYHNDPSNKGTQRKFLLNMFFLESDNYDVLIVHS